jgi:hypothetical protein
MARGLARAPHQQQACDRARLQDGGMEFPDEAERFAQFIGCRVQQHDFPLDGALFSAASIFRNNSCAYK